MRDLDLAGLLGKHMSMHSVPGAAIGVLRDTAVTAASSGIADATTGEPVTADTRFAVGSLAKSMVATVIARLAEAGRLSLDDPVAAHVPELRGVGWAARATVRDLLANRSRLPLRAQVEFSAFPGEADDVLPRFAATIATGAPTARFWSYSNAGWCLLGRVIETLTGRTWEEAMRTQLLAPLAMHQMTFTSSPVAEPRAVGHRPTPDGPVPVEPWTPRSHGPAGSTLLLTLGDLLRFARRHLEDPSLALLRSPHAEVRIHAWLDAWCLGWARFDWDGGPVWGWDGLISGSRGAATGAAAAWRCGVAHQWQQRTRPVPVAVPHPDAGLVRDRHAGAAAGQLTRCGRRPGALCGRIRLAGLALGGDGQGYAPPHGRRWWRGRGVALDDCTFVVDANDPDTPTMTFGGFGASGRPAVLYQMLWGLPRV